MGAGKSYHTSYLRNNAGKSIAQLKAEEETEEKETTHAGNE